MPDSERVRQLKRERDDALALATYWEFRLDRANERVAYWEQKYEKVSMRGILYKLLYRGATASCGGARVPSSYQM